MRFAAILSVILFVLAAACKSPASADSCSASGKSGPHLFSHKKQEGHGKEAEKGKKKQRDKTKAEKRWHLFRRKKEGEKDADKQDKGLFHSNGKKQRKTVKKRTRHPQNGLFPKGVQR